MRDELDDLEPRRHSADPSPGAFRKESFVSLFFFFPMRESRAPIHFPPFSIHPSDRKEREKRLLRQKQTVTKQRGMTKKAEMIIAKRRSLNP